MYGLNNYSDDGRKFYESLGLLVAREISAEKAAELSGFSFGTYMELLEKINIYPYIYDNRDYEPDLKTIDKIISNQ